MGATIAAPAPVDAVVEVELLDLATVVHSVVRHVRLGPSPREVRLKLRLPPVRRHGYGLRLHVRTVNGVVTRRGAVEAIEGWWESPRMAAVTGYLEPLRTARAVADLARWHVTVAQHYDWMWRHYRYEPPEGGDAFEDALGRSVSQAAVRGGIEAGHAAGIASLAYGSVYGAEREHVEAHPEDRVFSRDGDPLSLGDTFFINDIRPGAPWRRRLLAEYVGAIRSFGFDGIHMDTYGQPHEAWTADGEHIDFSDHYPGLIGEAARVVEAVRPGARVTFNCVDGWPLEVIAPAPAACLYLELWSPDRAFRDVVREVERARSVATGRQVVIAAYAAALRDAVARPRTVSVTRRGAIEATLLLGSVISAAGAYHHVLAEDDRLLVEGYYPAAVALRPVESRELAALWEFGARYVHLLSDPSLAADPVEGVGLADADGRSLPTSATPDAGSFWVWARRSPDGTRLLHLVDLAVQVDDHWDSPKAPTGRHRGLRLAWPGVSDALAASPWTAGGDPRWVRRWGGDARALRQSSRGFDASLALPSWRRWLVLVAPPVEG